MNEIKTFSLKFREIPIKIEDESGTVSNYVLREFDGTSRDKYLNWQRSVLSEPDANGNRTVKDLTDHGAKLLSMTLYLADQKHPVTIDAIRKFPSVVQSQLHELAAKLCGLVSDEETAKNE